MSFKANKMEFASKTPLAPLQSCARFCLEPETFPIFLAWLKKNHSAQPPEWFAEHRIRSDIEEAHDLVGRIEEMAERAETTRT